MKAAQISLLDFHIDKNPFPADIVRCFICKVTETSLLEYCHTGIGQYKFESCPYSTEALIALFSIYASWYDFVRDEVEIVI